MDASHPHQHQDMCTHPAGVEMAAHNVQPSSFTQIVTQQPLGYSPSGQGQHIQHGPYAHVMLYGPPQYHTALPVQYGYMTSMGGPPKCPQPDASWFPTASAPVPMPYMDTLPPMGSPVNLERLAEGEGCVNTYSRGQNHETSRNDALHSRQWHPSLTLDPLEVENARL
jgi:hypothetical protein